MKSFISTINKYSMIDWDDSVIVAVSGGADSMALLSLFLELKSSLNLKLRVVHINHGLRDTESDRDEDYVRKICYEWGVELDITHVDVKAEALRLGKGVEETGRVLRYQVFENLRAKHEFNKIAVAHNKNDNAETLLMWLFRGAGLNGLCGIPPVRGRVIRPLLETSRKDIEDYCAAKGIVYRIDLTNLETEYRRNKLRGELIPLICREYNPSIIDTLARTSESLTRDSLYLEKTAFEAYKNISTASGSSLRIDAVGLNQLDTAIGARVIRIAAGELKDAFRDLYSKHIENILRLAKGSTGKKISLPGGLYAAKEYDALILGIVSKEQNSHAVYKLELDVPITAAEFGIRAVLTEKEDFFIKLDSPVCTKEFSYDKIDEIFEIRGRRPGDRIYVSSMGGNKKIQDYFTDIKLPAAMRDSIPLVACGSDIVWIIDNKSIVSDKYKARDGSSKLYIHVIAINAAPTEQ